jgi:hypothetical protein
MSSPSVLLSFVPRSCNCSYPIALHLARQRKQQPPPSSDTILLLFSLFFSSRQHSPILLRLRTSKLVPSIVRSISNKEQCPPNARAIPHLIVRLSFFLPLYLSNRSPIDSTRSDHRRPTTPYAIRHIPDATRFHLPYRERQSFLVTVQFSLRTRFASTHYHMYNTTTHAPSHEFTNNVYRFSISNITISS